MKVTLKKALNTSLLLICGLKADRLPPTPVVSLGLDELSPPAVRTTISFASERVIVIARYPGSKGSFSGTMATIELRDNTLRVSSTADISLNGAGFGGGLFAAAHGAIVSKLTRPPELLSSDLKTRMKLPIKILIAPAHQANTVADYGGFAGWKLYRLVPRVVSLRSGEGEVLAVSDDYAVSRTSDAIRVETINGDLLASFGAPLQSQCHARAAIVGSNTTTGKICFNLENRGQMFGNAGEYHADISPSGRLVALVTTSKLSVYKIPEVCTM
jgi:hypothetical protein